MRITAIRQTAPGRLTVAFEDGTEIKSTLSAVTDLRLYSGRDLDEEEMEALRLSSGRGNVPAVDVSAADFDEE